MIRSPDQFEQHHSHNSEIEETDVLLEKKPSQEHDQNLTGSNESKKEWIHSDTKAFIILSFLYFVQGLPLGFFMESVSLILMEAGVSYADLSKMSLVSYPYAFKIFLAPFVDTVYSSKFGKRKSYVIPCLLFSGTGMVIFTFYLRSMISEKEITVLTILGFLLILAIAIQDIAVDGWVVTLISKENLSVAGAFSKISMFAGSFVGYNLFIPLNSVEFCNKYIFSEPRAKPLIGLEGFCLFIGMTTIIVALSLLFFKEKPIREEHVVTFKEVVVLFKKFVTGKHLRIFALVVFFSNISSSAVTAIFDPLIIQKGYRKEDYTVIKTMMVPFLISASAFGVTTFYLDKPYYNVPLKAYLNRRGRKEIILLIYAFALIVLTNFLCYWIVDNYDQLTYKELSISIFLYQTIKNSLVWFYDACFTSYVLKVSHESTASTFITAIYSISNFSGMWPASTSLALRSAISTDTIIILSTVIGLSYVAVLYKYLLPLQAIQAEEFEFQRELLLQRNPQDQDENFENFQTPPQVTYEKLN